MRCPSCGSANPDGQRFCGECGSNLGGALPRGERKVVTALFCDLVGFTALSERADPEDVDQMLSGYFSMARLAIESFGGVVEKFIGDAVVGVFGVPSAHEDDAERAVRAGLRIVEDAEELPSVGDSPLRLRIGINTGQAFVRLGVAAASGEGFLTGDAINTASRIQAVAPEMGVAVGLDTHEATARVFEYEELEPVAVKGKSGAVRVFHAKSSTARLGTDLIRTHDSPFVGREIELASLKMMFDEVAASSSPHFVTIVGEAGIGKSRIVSELGAYVDARSELVTWRQGRCLPYGEGITFWALGEIVKAHAGILESDDAATADEKLQRVLTDGPDRAWFRQRLLPLIGIEAGSTAERDELFTAWYRFLEHVAEAGPTVLVFEDLHWADPSMLAFLEFLAARPGAVPLLIVATTRPELFERHPDLAAATRAGDMISLTPLSEADTTRLISALLEAPVTPAELQGPVLDRAGGNPLYAEEFVRLLRDRGLLRMTGTSWQLVDGAEIPFPDSIHALLAARLDTLPPEGKSMLSDAAVIGKVFWAGAVATMGGISEATVVEAMRELGKRDLVRPARHSSIDGEREYAFWHVLAQDVAYSQLPRQSRAAKHVAAATWLTSKAPERLEDLADVLAHHYTSALELALATGNVDQASQLEAPARRFLTLAGERAIGLDTAAAFAAFERALHLTPTGHPERAEALSRFGEAATQFGSFPEAVEALREATTTFRERGDVQGTARALRGLWLPLQYVNEPSSVNLASEALSLLEQMSPSPELVQTLISAGVEETFSGRPQAALELLERALATAETLSMPAPARAVAFRGMTRCMLGDAGGLKDYRRGLALALESGDSRTAASIYNNYAINLRSYEGAPAALDVFSSAAGFAEKRGLNEVLLGIRASALPAMVDAGRLDEVVQQTRALRDEAEARHDEFDLMEIIAVRALALAYLGRIEEAEGSDRMLAAARRSARPTLLSMSISSAATVAAAQGATDEVGLLLKEADEIPDLDNIHELAFHIAPAVRAAVSSGYPELGQRLIDHLAPRDPFARCAIRTTGAALAEARNDLEAAIEGYSDAAAGWETLGVVTEQGFALLGWGRCLRGRPPAQREADVLERCRQIFARCAMRPALAEVHGLLGEGTGAGG